MKTKEFEKMIAEKINFEPLEIEIARRLGMGKMGIKIEGGVKKTQVIRFKTNELLSE